MEWPGWGRAAYVAVVASLFVGAQVEVWAGTDVGSGGRWVGALLACGITLPLLLRRAPLTVLVVVFGCAALDHEFGSGLGWTWFATVLAVYGLGRRAGTRAAVTGMAIVGALVLAIDVPRLQDGAPAEEILPAWFFLAGTFGFGRWMRGRGRESEALRERAAALERDRRRATREAVAEEQARIARELHDLVAHALAVIVVQAQAAGRVVGTDPAQARQALTAIEAVGREGLVELRRLLDVLDPVAPAGDASRPGLAQLEELANRVRGAGLPVDVVVTGSPRNLPPGLDLSAYRIVQEALTNTLKHAGPASSTVTVRYLPEAVEVEVTDDGTATGRAPYDGRVGRGLIGMRERTALYGGTLVAEHEGASGFRVRATFPLVAT